MATGSSLVEHGKQGEGVKPGTTDKGVTVRFPGNKGAISCHLVTVVGRLVSDHHLQRGRAGGMSLG